MEWLAHECWSSKERRQDPWWQLRSCPERSVFYRQVVLPRTGLKGEVDRPAREVDEGCLGDEPRSTWGYSAGLWLLSVGIREINQVEKIPIDRGGGKTP